MILSPPTVLKVTDNHQHGGESRPRKENNMKTFKVNGFYTTQSICDSDCIFRVLVIKRTEKTVTVRTDDGEIKRCKPYIDRDGSEYIKPYGNYSMCPIIRA